MIAQARARFSAIRAAAAQRDRRRAFATRDASAGSGAPTHRRAPLALAALCIALLALALSATSAAAAPRELLTPPSPFGSGLLASPVGLAVDNSASVSAGDVYVASFAEEVVQFDEEGNKVGAITNADVPGGNTPLGLPAGVAVNPANGWVYVTDLNGPVSAFDAEGNFQFQIPSAGLPVGIDVDPEAEAHGISGAPAAGILYVDNRAGGMIEEFNAATGAAIGSFGSGLLNVEGSESGNVAVDGAGNVYVANQGKNITEFSAASDLATTKLLDTANSPITVAVAAKNDHLLIGERPGGENQISEFEADPEPADPPLLSFGSGVFGSGDNVFGLGANATTDEVYAADFSQGQVYAFSALSGGGVPKHTLTVEKTGTGSGTVTSAPGGIDCGGTCEHEFAEGRQITLTATAPLGTAFAGWGPGCETEVGNECKLKLSADATIEAEFETVPVQTLSVEKTGPSAASGSVTGTSPGPEFTAIECGATCTAEYNEGAKITLTAAHNERTTFAGWTGCDATPSETECEVEMSAAKSVSAEFAPIPQQTLTVQKTGSGEGSVTGTSPGPEFEEINCGSKCSETYNQGATITLTAIPLGEKTVFAAGGWEGCDNVTVEEKCEVEMTAAKTVKAIFEEIPQQELKVEKTGSGSGTVTGTKPGEEFTAIECGATCSAKYNEGAEITLTATRTSPSLFGGWSGCATLSGPENEECHVTLGASDLTVAATFTTPVPPLATTGEATTVGRAAATVHGSYDAEGSPATYRFLYVDAAHYKPGANECLEGNGCAYALGSSTAPQNGATDSTEHAVTEALHGLKSGTTYHYALLVENPGGAALGADATFTTSAQPPSAATGAPQGIGPDSATLTGSLDANGIATTYRFELGTSAAYTTTVFGSAGDEKGSFEVSLPMGSLQPGTTYHYRLVAKNSDGTATGADATFTTTLYPQGVLPPPPVLKPRPVTPPSPTCKRGFVRKHGKCVKKKARHKSKNKHKRTRRDSWSAMKSTEPAGRTPAKEHNKAHKTTGVHR